MRDLNVPESAPAKHRPKLASKDRVSTNVEGRQKRGRDYNPIGGNGTLVNMTTSRFATAFASLMLASNLLAPAISHAQTAGQDAHAAGQDTKNAAEDTGHAVKHGTKTTVHKTERGTHTATRKTESGTTKTVDKTKEGGTIAVDKTKEGTVKGYDKTKEGTEKVLGIGNHSKTVAHDKAKETHMDAKDNAQINKDKVQANAPH
jgi:hypothetical protein